MTELSTFNKSAQQDTASSSGTVDKPADAPSRQISRRTFLKNAGMISLTTGMAGTVVLTKAGKQLGPAMSGGVVKRPWWVRKVDEPTTGINWDIMQRVNAAQNTLLGTGLNRFASEEENNRLENLRSDIELYRMVNDEPGFTAKDVALNHALRSVRNTLPRSFLGPQQALRPQDYNQPRWEGTPEEASHMLKAAMRQLGAATVGIVHLDERNRKLIYSVDPDGKRLEFADVDEAYEDDEQRVIPNRADVRHRHEARTNEDRPKHNR